MLKLKELINIIDSNYTTIEIYTKDYKKIQVLENQMNYELRAYENYSVFELDTSYKTKIESKNSIVIKTILIIRLFSE